ncbi:CopD family protein [Crocinitomix sp.]|nr:CopD family protein [Crocinitomix sp.]
MYKVILSLHLIFIVTWFAGLFYIVRLFVYHAEAEKKDAPEKGILIAQYRLMSKRLWYGITWPSFIATLLLGPSLLYLNSGLLYLNYMQIKLIFVAFLIAYQFVCHSHFKKLQDGTAEKSSNYYRIMNEVPTLFLVAIVFLIIMQNEVNWIYGTIGFFALGILLMLAIKIYKKLRKN